MKASIIFAVISVALSLVVIFGQGEAHDGGATFYVTLSQGEERLDVDFGFIEEDASLRPTTGPDSPTATPTDTTPTTRNKTTLLLSLLAMMSYWLWRRRIKSESTVVT